jgi:tRNA pseudouridine55 synthase
LIPFSGVLPVDKPVGPTSHDLVASIRRAAGMRKVGHAGTLDPFASGLLLVLLGSATRLSEYFLGMDKEYEAVVRLGIETDSHDVDGEVVSEESSWTEVTPSGLEQALEPLRGPILQRPPVFSAKKVQGEPAHRRVRRGETVELEPVPVVIHELEITEVALPELHMRVRCSSGTYLRALARDLGRSLGVGAHLTALRRTEIGPFSVSSAEPLGTLSSPEEVRKHLIPPAQALAHLPTLEIGQDEATRIRQGQFLPVQGRDLPEQMPVRVLLEGNLVAVAAREGEQVRPRKVLADG